MQHLYSPQGAAALTSLFKEPALIAFDFDGTLAPIRVNPQRVAIAPEWVADLRRIGQHWPLAIISGRQLKDLRLRLGFEPAFVAGNHGAESVAAGAPHSAARGLDAARRLLSHHQKALLQLGVDVEDKELSLAVHYRRSARAAEAARRAARLLATLPAELCVSHGKAVFNITLRALPDKGDALRQAMQMAGVERALYVGDDVNDEPAFATAPPACVTVRIGDVGSQTQARFTLGKQCELALLLRWLAGYPRRGRLAANFNTCRAVSFKPTIRPEE